MEENTTVEKKRNPWSWISTLYFTEGLPYAIVITISLIMYKRMGISNSDISLYTSWLYLPWIIKPLWSPIVDALGTKRLWIISMEFLMAICMAGVGLTIPMPDFLQFTIVFFWIIAFAGSTHEIAADGFYMSGLSESKQSLFIGFRTAFYKLALVGAPLLIILFASYLEGIISVHSTDFRVVSSPNKFFEETIKVDSIAPKELPGRMRLVAKPSYVEISTKPMTREQVNFYLNFAKTLNIMNGFSRTTLTLPDTTGLQDLVGNIGIVKIYLSKKPDEGDEHIVGVDFKEGNERIKVLVGKDFHFNSNNWNKPAFAVVQLDSTLSKKSEAIFIAQPSKIPLTWVLTSFLLAGFFLMLFAYHKYFLPIPLNDKPAGNLRMSSIGKEYFRSFARFFEKKKIIIVILFLILFGFGQAQILKISSLFLLDAKEAGGLELSTSEFALAYGWAGLVALIIGGVLGGFAITKKGLKYWLWPMLLVIGLPDITYLFLALVQPNNIWITMVCIAVESFGYGFGLTFIMMYMIYVSQGDYRTSHFAIAAGFMALGMMISGMMSGTIQEALGYKYFFIWTLTASIPGLILAKFLPLEYSFGKRKLTERD